MDLLQFSLFFAALLVGYLLIHLRMVRFEQYLKEMAGIRTLNQRLEAVAAALERVRLDRVEELLGQLHEDLGALHRATADVEAAVVRMPQAAAAPAAASAPVAMGSGERIQAVVETRLLQLGYGDLRILTDLGRVSLEGDLEVQVECERVGMPCKGRVPLRDGAVRQVQIERAAESFALVGRGECDRRQRSVGGRLAGGDRGADGAQTLGGGAAGAPSDSRGMTSRKSRAR